jgi:Ser/Thr protein kinase RdoA (MazF antagonist)
MLARRVLSAELGAMTGPDSIVHGDAHPGNVVVTAQGPVLVDFDLAGVGLASWDLTVAIVHHRRFGMPSRTLSAALRAYGTDPRGHPGFDTLARLQELLYLSLRTGAPDRRGKR